MIVVEKRGDGDGSFAAETLGVECEDTCAFPATGGVVLTAQPAESSVFVGWSGACSGTESCEVMVGREDVAVTATFSRKDVELTVISMEGGSVTTDPMGIDCSGECAATFKYGTRVTLTEVPAPGYLAGGWDAPECGLTSCVIDLVEPRTFTASFVPPHTLTVVRIGSGRVTSAAAGIDCGASCTASIGHGDSVVLTATPDPGFWFWGWEGTQCHSTDPTCAMVVNSDQTLEATFMPNVKLFVSSDGTGQGSIRESLNPAGTVVNEGPSFVDSQPPGTYLKLQAVPAPGSRFVSWGGACAGSLNPCYFALGDELHVTATFDLL
jgi:hypothetical protein